MMLQLLNTTPTHQAASQLEEAISLLEETLLSSDCGPMVERLEQCLRSIRKEQQRLQRAVETNDFESVLNIQIHLMKKVARALRIFKSMFTV